MATLTDLLQRVEAVVSDGGHPIIVFDLDSTLFDTAGRHLAILRAFAEQAPQIRPIVDELGLSDFGWHVHAPLRTRGVDDPALFKALERFWFDRFFHDDWVGHDHPAAGAPEFVRACWERGCTAYYLTGRDAPNMATGTVRALQKSGFPMFSGRSLLHLKPDFKMPDAPFKQDAIHAIRQLQGTVVATFENEPGNAKMFMDAFPEAVHYLVGSVRSPESPEPDPALVQVPDFRH